MSFLRPNSSHASFQHPVIAPPVSRTPSLMNQSVRSSSPSRNEIPAFAPPSAGRVSPSRPWSPSRLSSELPKPPPSNLSFEPVDLNGSPRPGSPSRRAGSPQRPLPPAPLFSIPLPSQPTEAVHQDEAAIPIDDEADDVFAPAVRNTRSSLRSHASFQSEST